MRILVVLAAATIIGAGYGRYRGVPLWPDVQQIKKTRDAREVWKQETAISLDDFVRHYQSGRLVIDARATEQFEEGHLDAPLIMNIPAEEADKHLERALAFLGTPIVIYCSSDDCESAEMLWNTMQRSWSFPKDKLRVFHAGWAGIQAAKLGTVSGPDTLLEDEATEADAAQTAAAPADSTDPQPGNEGAEGEMRGTDEEGENP